MTTTLPTTVVLPPVGITNGENRCLLQGVRWETYERLLDDCADQSLPHFTYDRGNLEIVSPYLQHESREWLLENLVTTILDEWDTDYLCLRHLPLRREDRAQGCEPDSCFYIANIAKVEGQEQIRLMDGDPPPDLVIEVDITSPSVDKLPIYAAFGVPEVWRCVNNTVTILALEDGVYTEQDHSLSLSNLTTTTLNEFLVDGIISRQRPWLRRVRAWARASTPL